MGGIAWQLRYDDGSTFTSLDGAPEDSPPWGCVGVIQPTLIPDDPDWCIVGAEYLLWRTDLQRWTKCGDIVGLVDQLTHRAHLIACVRPGRYMPTRDYKALWAAARAEWGVG